MHRLEEMRVVTGDGIAAAIRRHTALAGLLASALLVGACQTAMFQAPAEEPLLWPGQEVDAEVFVVAFERIHQFALDEVDLSRMVARGLDGLEHIDTRLEASISPASLTVSFDRRPIATFERPLPTTATAWGELTAAAIFQARTVSVPLLSAEAEDIYQAVFDGALGTFDRATRYAGAKRAEGERAVREGYGGVGILIEFEEGRRPFVGRVFPDGPADGAGILPGDTFLAINGELIESMDQDDIGQRVRGPVGTTVTITLDQTERGVNAVELTREQVIPTVVQRELRGDALIVAVGGFNAATAAQVEQAVLAGLEAADGDISGLVIDLRGNPGGLLGQSIAVADLFIDEGSIISTRGRHPGSRQDYLARSSDILHGAPIIVLADGGSASGAEVLAAALQDSGRAILIGSSTYGKGSVQTVTRLPNGGDLYLTWSLLYTPAGYSFHEQGVMPVICTSRRTGGPHQVLEAFVRGDFSAPASLDEYRARATDDPAALAHLRRLCPDETRTEDIEIEVALSLLQDPILLAAALGSASNDRPLQLANDP